MGVIPGIEFNTFSITARCARTGMLGIAITTSDITVGSRCPYVMPSVGAISTQASLDCTPPRVRCSDPADDSLVRLRSRRY